MSATTWRMADTGAIQIAIVIIIITNERVSLTDVSCKCWCHETSEETATEGQPSVFPTSCDRRVHNARGLDHIQVM